MNRSVMKYLYFFQVCQTFVLFILFGSVVGTYTGQCGLLRAMLISDKRTTAFLTNFLQLLRSRQYDQILPSLLGRDIICVALLA
jgi:hypothetical protein